MKWDFRHHLLMQIEMPRSDISHEELSTRLDTLYKIAQALDLRLEELFKGF